MVSREMRTGSGIRPSVDAISAGLKPWAEMVDQDGPQRSAGMKHPQHTGCAVQKHGAAVGDPSAIAASLPPIAN